MSTYRSKETVTARKVTDKDGEDVVTTVGFYHAEKGDYVVVHESGDVEVVEAEIFGACYSAGGGTRKPAKKAAPKKALAKKAVSKKAAPKKAPAKKAAVSGKK